MGNSSWFGSLLKWLLATSLATAGLTAVTASEERPQPLTASSGEMLAGLLHSPIESPPAGAFTVSRAALDNTTETLAFRFGPPWNRTASYLQMRIGPGESDSQCWIYYHPPSNTLWRYDPPAAQGPFEPGSPTELTARGCIVDVSQSSVTATDDTVVITLRVRFLDPLAGISRNLYMQAQNDTAQTGWVRAVMSLEPFPDAATGLRRQTAKPALDLTPGLPPPEQILRLRAPTRRNAAPTFLSLTPTVGSGGGTFFKMAFQPGPALGYGSLLINSELSGQNACWLVSTVFPVPGHWRLYNDSATQLSPSLASSLSTTRYENSQCVVTNEMNDAPRGLAIAFKPSFAGPKKVFVLGATDSTLAESTGWIEAGAWTVTPTGFPMIVSRSPWEVNSGSPIIQVRVTDPAGYQNLTYVHLLLNDKLNPVNACWVFHHQPTGSMWLYNDAFDGILGPVYPGAWGTVENTKCQLSGIESWASGQGADLTVAFQLRFKVSVNHWMGRTSPVGGSNTVFHPYVWVSDISSHSGWADPMNHLPVSNLVNHAMVPPEVKSGSPPAGSGPSGSVSAVFESLRDFNSNPLFLGPNPPGQGAHILVMNGPTAVNACWVFWEASTGKLHLINDAVTGRSGSLTPGQPGTVENSQCVLHAQSSSAVKSFRKNPDYYFLTLTLDLAFKPAFQGQHDIRAYVVNGDGNSGWSIVGRWTVP